VEPSNKSKDTVIPVVTPAQLLKNNGFDIDCNMSELPKALKWAAGTGNVDVMELLLTRKPQITSQNGYGDLMEVFVRSGNDELLRLMMDHQVDMNIASDEGWTALFYAACLDQEKMMEMLLNPFSGNPFSGVSINLQDNHGSTALHMAAEMDNDAITKMLIQSGANVNALDDQGESPLHKAAGMGRKDNARLLLNAGANIETANEEGIIALREALEHGNDGVVRLLLQRGANTRSAYVGPFLLKYPHTSKEGFEASKQAIMWWQEENNKKSEMEMAKKRKLDQSMAEDVDISF
jgi:ankyrin repeat protein